MRVDTFMGILYLLYHILILKYDLMDLILLYNFLCNIFIAILDLVYDVVEDGGINFMRLIVRDYQCIL